TSEDELTPGTVFRLEGRDWLVEAGEDGDPARVIAKPARYRLVLRHPHRTTEPGAFRRYRPDAPRRRHSFNTIEDRSPISWGGQGVRGPADPGGDRGRPPRALRRPPQLRSARPVARDRQGAATRGPRALRGRCRGRPRRDRGVGFSRRPDLCLGWQSRRRGRS